VQLLEEPIQSGPEASGDPTKRGGHRSKKGWERIDKGEGDFQYLEEQGQKQQGTRGGARFNTAEEKATDAKGLTINGVRANEKGTRLSENWGRLGVRVLSKQGARERAPE